ncbi:MAG: hypothetical protein LBB24_03790, partial [Rickettsiales bacterium]|nr:hypothetical protein [Rickettsiales bacterium]
YYGSYTISAITAIISSIGRRSIPLLVANVGYLCLDVFALLNQFKKVRSAALVSGLLLRLALQN